MIKALMETIYAAGEEARMKSVWMDNNLYFIILKIKKTSCCF